MPLVVLGAQTTASACQVPAEHRIFNEPVWFGLYWNQAKVGYYHGYGARTDPQRYEMSYEISVTLDGKQSLTRETRYYDSQAPHALLGGSLTRGDERIAFRQIAEGLQVDAGEQSLRWERPAWTLCDEEVLVTEQKLNGPAQPGDTFETQFLDIRSLQTVTLQHQVTAIERQQVLGVEHVFQTLLSQIDQDAMNTRVMQRFRDGYAITLNLGQLQARLESREQALSPPQDVGQIDLLTIPVADTLEPARLTAIDAMQFRVSIDDPLITIRDAVQDGLLQQVQYLDDRTALVTVADFPDHAQPQGDVSRYLAANFTYPADHPRIRAIARTIRAGLADADDQRALAEAILHHTAGAITYELIGTASVLEVLDTQRGDCTEYAQMFVSLARAAGLPAREVTGFIYTGDARTGSFGGHAWVEVLVDGRWTSMDPTGNQVVVDKAHLQFRNFMAANLQLKIESVQFRPAG